MPPPAASARLHVRPFPLAPQFRPLVATNAPNQADGAAGADADANAEPDDRSQLSNGEYRTVLAAQRTVLAFLRTALAVLVVFRNNAFGPILGSLVALVGILQFATTTPLFLLATQRVPKPGVNGGRADARLLFRWTQAHSVIVCTLVVVCVSIAIPWRFNREVEDGTADAAAAAAAAVAMEVFD